MRLFLATGRRIVELDRFVKEGNWKPTTNYHETYGKDVNGTTLGIIGMGRIGEAIAKRAKFGFNMDVLYYNRNRKPEAEEKYGAVYCELDITFIPRRLRVINDTAYARNFPNYR